MFTETCVDIKSYLIWTTVRNTKIFKIRVKFFGFTLTNEAGSDSGFDSFGNLKNVLLGKLEPIHFCHICDKETLKLSFDDQNSCKILFNQCLT